MPVDVDIGRVAARGAEINKRERIGSSSASKTAKANCLLIGYARARSDVRVLE